MVYMQRISFVIFMFRWHRYFTFKMQK